MTIGDRIKKQRESINISQTELAEKIGISKQTLYKYENNIVTNIPSDKIELIAKVLGTTPSYIMGWEVSITLYNVHCETADESELILSYRKLSGIGKKKVSSYTGKLLEIETAESEVVAAHERADMEITDNMRKHDNDIMNEDNF